MGYISYEMCLGAIGVKPSPPLTNLSGRKQPDVTFIFIERSLVIDKRLNIIHIQSIHKDDMRWVLETKEKLELIGRAARATDEKPSLTHGLSGRDKLSYSVGDMNVVDHMDGVELGTLKAAAYTDRVRQCQEYIREGQSYELCLTSQAMLRVIRPRVVGYEWSLFNAMRVRNPAPFCAYFRVGQTTIISCSPERFLRWSREGTHQMRPIKGTVSKDVVKTRQEAEKLLSQPKEQAENLMIVDLIRHDMHGVLGSGGVHVRSLMRVEEYRRVYQLVSVIEGWSTEEPQIPSGTPKKVANLIASRLKFEEGHRLLAASLPPGSMTGAPKIRSCELLKSLESGRPRGIYSGVFGYMCVGGGGDFSVMIRSAFKWGEDDGTDWPRPSKPETTAAVPPHPPPPPTTTKTAATTKASSAAKTTTSGVKSSTSAKTSASIKDSKPELNKRRNGKSTQDKKVSSRPEPTQPPTVYDYWRFGAGGAVTALSSPDAEYEEMRVKLLSTLAPFTAGLTEVYEAEAGGTASK